MDYKSITDEELLKEFYDAEKEADMYRTCTDGSYEQLQMYITPIRHELRDRGYKEYALLKDDKCICIEDIFYCMNEYNKVCIYNEKTHLYNPVGYLEKFVWKKE